MALRPYLLVLPAVLGLGLTACREQEEAKLPANPNPPPRMPAASGNPGSGEQGLKDFFAPRPGETWTYLVHRDLPPDSLLNDDDQLRSSDLAGGGYRFTSERQRVCLGTQQVEGETHPLTLFELSQDGVPTGREYLDIGPEGLIARGWQQAGNNARPVTLLDPGVLLAAPGMSGGQSWESTGSSPDQPIQFRVIERSSLEVPAGNFEAVRIQMNTGTDSRGVRRTLWFAENVGIVQEETIHYDEHRIKVRETITLTAWTLPEKEEEESGPPPAEVSEPIPEVLPPPPDEEIEEEELPAPLPDEDNPIESPGADTPEEDEGSGGN